MLSSLVRQLSTTRDDGTIQALIFQSYDQERQIGFASGKLKFEQSLSLLARLINIYPQVTLIIDALDECNRHTRTKLIDALDKVVLESTSLLKVFISSRPDGDIKHRFGTGPNMEIRATDNRDDIALYVNNRLGNPPWDWGQRVTPVLRAYISEVIIDKSDGM